MEADWEFEIAPGAPVIEAAWEGFVDLRAASHRVAEIGEIAALPGLAPALLRINSPASGVRTSKCDVWIPETGDVDELDAAPEEAACVLACYIDVLPRNASDWATPADAEAFCRRLCRVLQAVPARCCRADLVVRRALQAEGEDGLGITAYLTASGADSQAATAALERVLSAFADSFRAVPTGQSSLKSLQ